MLLENLPVLKARGVKGKRNSLEFMDWKGLGGGGGGEKTN